MYSLFILKNFISSKHFIYFFLQKDCVLIVETVGNREKREERNPRNSISACSVLPSGLRTLFF